MNKIIFPLQPAMKGPTVADLQTALQLILEHAVILVNDPGARKEMSTALARERLEQVYRDATQKLVAIFQEERHLATTEHGTVDEPTANAINALLKEWGQLGPLPDGGFVVSGQVSNSDGSPVKGCLVRAFHDSGQSLIRLGEDPADAEGRYTIHYSPAPGTTSVNLQVQAYSEDGTLLQSSAVVSPAKQLEVINLTVPILDKASARVFGSIRNEFGEPLDRVTVQAFDRDLRNEESLGSTVARAGEYEIRYLHSQFLRAEKGSADLVMKVLGADGRQLYQTPISYNVSDEQEINIVLQGGTYKGPSKWEALTSSFLPLLDGMSPLDLREDDQNQDISFLAGETGNDQLTIATWMMCFRLADKTTQEKVALPPEMFFGFLAQGQPSIFYDTLLQDLKLPDRVALLEDKTLRLLAEIIPDLQQSLLEKAVADNLIPGRIEPQIKDFLEVLKTIHLRNAADMTFGGGKGSIAQLLALTPEAQNNQAAFLDALTNHSGSMGKFWSDLQTNKVLSPEAVQQVRLSFELGALTRNHIPLVTELVAQFQRGELKDKRQLARFGNDDWIALFMRPGPDGKPIGVPANIDGDTFEAKLKQFAVIMEQQFQRAYPTTAFAAKLGRSDQSPVPAKGEVVRFLENNPNFQLDRFRVEHYLAQNKLALQGIEDTAGLVKNLKSVQRVFKLNPTHEVVTALLERKIDSAQKIYFLGVGQLSSALAGSSINKLEVKKIYRKAENTYAMALTLFGDYNLSINGTSPQAVPAITPPPDLQAKIAALPNLQTLFGSLDYCECTDCRSVYSLSAYFVDVMRFLGARGTQGTGVNAGRNVRDVLLDRRPDLGEIELSCENTNTPLPYIDLVNEILEDAIAPPAALGLSAAIEADLVAGLIKFSVLAEIKAKGAALEADAQVYAPDIRANWVVRDSQHSYKIYKDAGGLNLLPTHQTSLSAAELSANPEYTNQNTYNKLKDEIFPLNLPFDLWQVQTRTYLTHLGVPRPRLLELFQQKLTDDVTLAPSDLEIDCAWLALIETERQILTGTLAGKQPWEFWGLAQAGNNIPNPNSPADPTANVTGTWIDVLASVDVMLNRTALAYKELLQLLDMQYINPNGSIFIFDAADPNAAQCDTSKFAIRNLNEDALTRINRFLRLWRKLKCEMWELDMLLPDMNPAPLVIDKQITDAALQAISAMARLRARFDGDWRVTLSLYAGIDQQVYFDRAQDGAPTVQTLYQRLFRNKLVDAVASFPTTPDQITGTIEDKIPGILAAFRIKEADLTLILGSLGLMPTDALDLTVLSHIYRITVLARGLNLKIDPFLRLQRLWSKDPFVNAKATLDFVELAEQIAASNFSVEELDYLLAHRFLPISGVALDDKTIVAVMQSIREGLQKIDDDLRLKTEETPAEYVKTKLGVLPTLTKDADQVTALSLIDGSWQGTVADRDHLLDVFFANVFDLAMAKINLGPLPGGLSPAAQQAEVDKRFAYAQPGLEAFLLTTQKETFIRQKAAEMAQLDVPSASSLLASLHLPGSASSLLQNMNDPHLLDQLPDGSYQLTLGEADFPNAFKSFRLLHKAAMVIRKLQMEAAAVAWWLDGTHAADMGWMGAGEFPLDNTTQIDIQKWISIQQFFTWKKSLTPSDLTVFELATNILDATQSSAANMNDLAQVTGWEISDLQALAQAFHWVDVLAGFDVLKAKLKLAANLLRLADCMGALRRLGVNAARAISWAKAEPDDTDAESLKQTVKSKYDLTQWEQVIQPLQDEFRERKREALSTWLVTHPDQTKSQNWTDLNGVYSYYLIDVEMSACMLTSRLKQAVASAQLFVQRCLMNLETDIFAQTDLDPKWTQWKWMKQYRLWEANRKVFLYPENWIEPELRDEKSPFFVDLENELKQNDITNDTAEDAYLNYLEKLDAVANLEIRALCNETMSQDEAVLHVFGRQRSSLSPQHYYRQRINGARWTAWEKVELDISGDHLIAGVENRRLYLLWPQFLSKADPPTNVATPTAGSSTSLTGPTKYWEVRLFWSELKKKKWLPKVLSDQFIRVNETETAGDILENIEFRTSLMPFIRTRVYATDAATTDAPLSLEWFDKIGKQVTSAKTLVSNYLVSPPESQFSNNLIRHSSTTQYFYYNSVENLGTLFLPSHYNAPTIRLLQAIGPSGTYSVIDSQATAFASTGSFFVWDSRHTYLVDYSWLTNYSYVSKAWRAHVTSSFRFFIHYHPLVELFIKELNIWGIKGLLNRRIQVNPETVPDSPALFNFSDYKPDGKNVTSPLPIEDVDFSYSGAYALYNWELFFHVPLFIANRLSDNQRFEEALSWFHYIFDPTNPDNSTANADTPQQKFWITKPFYETTKADYYAQKIENIMLAIAQGDIEPRKQVEEWRDNPFNPHLIARLRSVAYQKNLLVKYIKTLIAWGDQLFGADTIESINEATQLYILAVSILGPRPKSIAKKISNPVKTYYQLQAEGSDDFGNVLEEVENLLPPPSSGSTLGNDAPELPHLDVLYFCIPNNENLLALWDLVDDRLFKIRHCMNLEGVVRQLPLFEPPIDPAILVKAVAAGLDIGAALGDVNASLPLYRFSFMIQRAFEICNEVKSLGAAMLAALEKRDSEGFALLRSTNERSMLDLVRLVKNSQIDEALRTKEALYESKNVTQERQAYYARLGQAGLNDWEIASLALTGGAIISEIVATVLSAVAAGTSFIPQFSAGAAGFGGTPVFVVTTGGANVSGGLSNAANVVKSIANILQMGSSMTATVGSYSRRADEWDFQRTLAEKELAQIDKQLLAAEIRQQIAAQDLTNHDKQIENAQKEGDYLNMKFTNEELYDWMVGQISAVYFQSYQLAYDTAKRAERCFRYELGLSDSSYIQFGYWDSLKKGLVSGEKLFYDLKRLELVYYEQNRREYELNKHVSLAQLDPIALLKLRSNGECFIDIPETAFDMDYPGHYFRRIKNVGLSLPCVTGPYTTIACTLTLTSNQLRKDSTLLANRYGRDLTIEDPRFRDEIAALQSIATSHGQNDLGVFELNFRDERYLPFEGAGAISSWHIKLNKDLPQFDFSTISDVILHLNYTAREGGEFLRSAAASEFNAAMNDLALAENRRGLYRIFDLKREYSTNWSKFLRPANPADEQVLPLDDLANRLPYFTQQFTKKVRQIEVVAQMKDAATYQVMLSPLGSTAADLLSLSPDPTYQGLHRIVKDLTGNEIPFDAWTFKLKAAGAADFKSLPVDAIQELFLIINYTLS